MCVCVCACIALLSAIRSNAHRHAQHADIPAATSSESNKYCGDDGYQRISKGHAYIKKACLLQLIKRTGLLLHYKVNLVIAFKSLKKYRTFYFLAKKMRVTIYTHINIYL